MDYFKIFNNSSPALHFADGLKYLRPDDFNSDGERPVNEAETVPQHEDRDTAGDKPVEFVTEDTAVVATPVNNADFVVATAAEVVISPDDGIAITAKAETAVVNQDFIAETVSVDPNIVTKMDTAAEVAVSTPMSNGLSSFYIYQIL